MFLCLLAFAITGVNIIAHCVFLKIAGDFEMPSSKFFSVTSGSVLFLQSLSQSAALTIQRPDQSAGNSNGGALTIRAGGASGTGIGGVLNLGDISANSAVENLSFCFSSTYLVFSLWHLILYRDPR